MQCRIFDGAIKPPACFFITVSGLEMVNDTCLPICAPISPAEVRSGNDGVGKG